MTKKTTIASLQEQVNSIHNSMTGAMSSFRNQVAGLLGMSHGGKRDLYDVYGYPKSLSGDSGFAKMYQYSRREGIANRITWGMAKACWRDGFKIVDVDDEGIEHELLKDQVEALERSGFNAKIERADILNRIGRMSVLFVGIPDGREPYEEVGPVAGGEYSLELLYFSPYAYDGIQISKTVEDPKDPRFGLPEIYTLSRTALDDNEKDASYSTIKAHWTRVIHLNENALESDIEGMGALEPVFNNILNIDKTCGGSSEAYFRNAKGKIAYEMDKDAANMSKTSKGEVEEGIQKYTNNFQDHTVAVGSTVKTLPTPHASPLDTVKVNLWGITAQTGLHVRVLTGEGGGQLAGSEDRVALNNIIDDRQRSFCSYQCVEPFLRMLERAKMLKLPERYDIIFPVRQASTEKELTDIGKVKADTIKAIADAKTTMGGDNIDTAKAMKACGIEEDITDGEPTGFDDSDLEDDGSEKEKDDSE